LPQEVFRKKLEDKAIVFTYFFIFLFISSYCINLLSINLELKNVINFTSRAWNFRVKIVEIDWQLMNMMKFTIIIVAIPFCHF